MNLLWQINPWEMLSDLIVTTFLILLPASVVVVSSMVMFPLIDVAFKKKAKPAPKDTRERRSIDNTYSRPAQVVEPWHHDGLTAHHAQLSGPPWLTLRSNFLRPDAVPHSRLMSDPTAQRAAPDPLVGMAYHALADFPLERITPLIHRSLAPERSEGAPPGPVTAPPTPATSNVGRI
jgi:hypothetical protein